MQKSLLRPITASLVLSLGLLGAVSAAPYTEINAEDSQISFGYTQMGVSMEGNFSQVSASEFLFDPAKPEDAQVTLEIPLTSVNAGYDDANAELAKTEWLNLAEHPVATFESTAVQASGDNQYDVTGTLSIKGQSQEVTAPFTFTEDGDVGIFEGSFSFQRADFAIGEGSWGDFSIVANDIQVNFHVVANQ